jgi:predicted dehydrogenase
MAEICDHEDIDALIIATPDFQHPGQTCLAVEAGKDVYVEKPLGCDFEQLKKARDVVRRSDRVVQMGTFRRSHGVPRAARDFIAQGRLGRVSYVEMVQPLFQQRWRIPGSEKSLHEDDTDWNEFLDYTPKVPFDARKYREFRLFWPYSTGIFCQWMSHAVDVVNIVLDQTPKSVVSSGGVYVWKDGRTNPDTAQCLIEYPRGCLFSYHMRLGNGADGRNPMFYGTNGTLDLYAGLAYGEGGGGDIAPDRPDAPAPVYNADAATRLPDRAKGGLMLDPPPDEDHMTNFLRCVRSRKKPNADIEAGFAHALATTMAGVSLRTGQRVTYDAEHETLLLTKQHQTSGTHADCG